MVPILHEFVLTTHVSATKETFVSFNVPRQRERVSGLTGTRWHEEHRTPNQENPGSNPLAGVSKPFTPRCLSSLSCVDEYLPVDSGRRVNE